MFRNITVGLLAAAVTVGGAASTCFGASASSSTCSYQEEVIAEDQQTALTGLAELRSIVDESVADSGIANSLDAKLEATTNSVLAFRIKSALNQIEAFANQVDALEQAGKISPRVSNIMKTKHDTVKNSISNIR
jgi:hypothetical protein